MRFARAETVKTMVFVRELVSLDIRRCPEEDAKSPEELAHAARYDRARAGACTKIT